MNERIKHPDKKNALSIITAAEQELQFTLKQSVTEESAFMIIRNIYECFRMLGDARLMAKGIVSKDHAGPINELKEIKVETQRPIMLIENLKKLRHSINYKGYRSNKLEAEDAISFAKACFYPLYNQIKKELN